MDFWQQLFHHRFAVVDLGGSETKIIGAIQTNEGIQLFQLPQWGQDWLSNTKNCQKTVQTRSNQQEKRGQEFVVASSLINHLDRQQVVPWYPTANAKLLSSLSSCVERLEHRLPDVWRPALPFAGNWEEHQHLSFTARVPENSLKRIFNKYQDWLCRTAGLHYGLDWTESNTTWFTLG